MLSILVVHHINSEGLSPRSQPQAGNALLEAPPPVLIYQALLLALTSVASATSKSY
ncbi:hypothetical protein [Scytonema sp. UIC 10036]|uniref:hypothetical protein n=1 Tax=Scytonema sp. UIC 10036 TaxID=2304196 RepID=UPI00140FD1EF|nr:hypothetical protein [Scytonema sp. UIC 10036]